MNQFIKYIVGMFFVISSCFQAFSQGGAVVVQQYRPVPGPYRGLRRPYRAVPQPYLVPQRGYPVVVQPPYGQPVYRSRAAQPPVSGNAPINKIEVIKENFFNRQLRLNPDQANRFWPVYREYQHELVAVRRAKRLNNSAAQPNGTEQINRDLAYEAQILEIRRRYNAEFLTILPAEKVSQLYKSEREFTDEMIRQLGERNQQGQAPAN